MSVITYNGAFGIYTIRDDQVLIDLFEAKIIDSILELREPSPEPISSTLASELVSNYIKDYNRAHKAGCRNIRDVAEFEAMRIRAGKEYSLGE